MNTNHACGLLVVRLHVRSGFVTSNKLHDSE